MCPPIYESCPHVSMDVCQFARCPLTDHAPFIGSPPIHSGSLIIFMDINGQIIATIKFLGGAGLCLANISI